jgi:signal peptide peptidase SppA
MTDPFKDLDESALNWKKMESLPLIGKFFKRGPKIPVIRLAGVIADATMKRGGISHARTSKLIDKAFAMEKAPAVALIINSPGGAPAQSQLIGGMIRRLADEKQISVIAFVEDVAASGGYWLACAADQIYAQETSIVGSIGVISAGFGFEDFIDRHGIKRRLHTSGREKSMLDPFLPEKPEDVSRLKDIQQDMHRHFIDWVKSRRGSRLNGRDDELFEGRFWLGSTALDMGLIDAIGDVSSVLKEKYGQDIRLVDLSPDKKLFPFLPRGLTKIENWADDLLAAIEDRSIWSRFGL